MNEYLHFQWPKTNIFMWPLTELLLTNSLYKEKLQNIGSIIYHICYQIHHYLHLPIEGSEDIDENCLLMTYVQLSLLGIDARCQVKNSLSNEVYSTWDTPFHFLTGKKL